MYEILFIIWFHFLLIIFIIIYRRGGKYSFSLRCLLELETYLRQTFGDNIHDCSLCHTIVTVDVSPFLLTNPSTITN